MHIFENYKSFAIAQLDLFKPLTVLIGPNGSGKSNTIEGIELFSFIAHGRHLHEIVDIGKSGGALQIRGGLQSCPRHGQKSFSFHFNASIPFERVNHAFLYHVEVEVEPQVRIATETLRFGNGVFIFKTLNQAPGSTSGDIKVEYNNFARGGRNPIASVTNNRSILSQYKEFSVKNTSKQKACFTMISGIMDYLKASFVFDPNPKLMRNYERIGDTVLNRDGSNLSAVLYGLKMGDEEDTATLERLVGWIRQMPEEPYLAIDFVTTSLNDVILGFQDTDDGPFVDARRLSDGTLRALAVLTALETVSPSSRVVIEEFDNGLHPSRVHILMEAITACCTRRKLNVIVTTHNPATLNALNENQYDGVVLCARDTESESFRLIKLSDLPRYDELLERGRLGDLVTQRIIEKYLAPHFEENHKEQSLNWLKSL